MEATKPTSENATQRKRPGSTLYLKAGFLPVLGQREEPFSNATVSAERGRGTLEPPMSHAVKDVHSILSGVARALKTRYGEPPKELPPRLTKLMERLEGQWDHVKDKETASGGVILRPLHWKVVCGFLWSPLFETNQAATPHSKRLAPRDASRCDPGSTPP